MEGSPECEHAWPQAHAQIVKIGGDVCVKHTWLHAQMRIEGLHRQRSEHHMMLGSHCGPRKHGTFLVHAKQAFCMTLLAMQ